MSAVDIVGLHDGAIIMQQKVERLLELVKQYRAQAEGYDNLVRMKDGALSSVALTITGRPDGSPRMGQKSFTYNRTDAEQLVDLAIEMARARCSATLAEIDKLKEDMR